jgi:hypothetical protein
MLRVPRFRARAVFCDMFARVERLDTNAIRPGHTPLQCTNISYVYSHIEQLAFKPTFAAAELFTAVTWQYYEVSVNM